MYGNCSHPYHVNDLFFLQLEKNCLEDCHVNGQRMLFPIYYGTRTFKQLTMLIILMV